MRTFTRGGYGRIYVRHSSDIPHVREIIRMMDQFGYEYLPDDLIAPIGKYPETVFTHKFDALDLDELTFQCFRRGCFIHCLDCGVPEAESCD
jgi:hypothetical protein